MQDFNPDMDLLDDAGWMRWLHRMELLARLGVVHRVPEIEAQVFKLSGMLALAVGWFLPRLLHDNFRRWGSYTGSMLKEDWK